MKCTLPYNVSGFFREITSSLLKFPSNRLVENKNNKILRQIDYFKKKINMSSKQNRQEIRIEFLKTEHEKMLSWLHKEIEDLKRKNQGMCISLSII